VVDAGAVRASLWVYANGSDVAILLATVTPRRHPKIHANVDQFSVYSNTFLKKMIGALGCRTANLKVCRLLVGCLAQEADTIELGGASLSDSISRRLTSSYGLKPPEQGTNLKIRVYLHWRMPAVGQRLERILVECFLNSSALASVSVSMRTSKFLRILTPRIARGLL
jgi:hypothetical protein